MIGDAPSLAALETQGFEGRTIRYSLLSAHYRRPLAYSAGRLEDAQRSLQRLDRCVQALRQVRDGSPSTDLDHLMYDLRQGVRRAFDDDLNLPAALVALFQAVKRINSLMANGRMDARGAGRLIALLRDIDAVLSILELDESRSVNTETRDLVAARPSRCAPPSTGRTAWADCCSSRPPGRAWASTPGDWGWTDWRA